MELIGYPETSVRKYHATLRKIPKEPRSNLHRGGSQKSRLVSFLVNRLINNAVCQLAKGTQCLVMLHALYLDVRWPGLQIVQLLITGGGMPGGITSPNKSAPFGSPPHTVYFKGDLIPVLKYLRDSRTDYTPGGDTDAHQIGGSGGPRDGLDEVLDRPLPEIEPRFSGRLNA